MHKLVATALAVFVAACATAKVGEPIATARPDVFIANVRIVDFSGDAPKVDDNMSVLIRDKRIAAVGRSNSLAAPDGALFVDGAGRTLIPGLVDMHVHVWDEAELGAYLSHGVTTVRNASGMPFHLRMQDRIESGELIGPRLITTGPILNGMGPNTQANHQIVDTADAARAAVRAQYETGYRRLKVYSNLPRASYEAIREEARRLGMTIMGHSPEGVREPGIPSQRPFDISFEELLDDGFATFEHMETIVWHALYDDLDEDKARSLAVKIAKANVAVDPTLLAYRNLVRVAETKGEHLSRPGTDTLNPFISELERETYDHWSRQSPERLVVFDSFYRRATKIFHEEGVALVTGTDAGIFTNIPGVSLIEELRLLVEAGLTPYDALQAATVNAAAALGEARESGRVSPGFRADLILVEDDPLVDVGAVATPAGIVRDGIWFGAEALAALRNGASRTSYDRTKENVMSGLKAQ